MNDRHEQHGTSDPAMGGVDRALTLMGSQQWEGSARNLRVEDAIAGRQHGSIGMKRKNRMIVAGVLVGLIGATAAAFAVRELVQVRGVYIDHNGNRVPFEGVAEIENGMGQMNLTGPNGEDLTVEIQTVDGDSAKQLQVDMNAPASKDGKPGQHTLKLEAGKPQPTMKVEGMKWEPKPK